MFQWSMSSIEVWLSVCFSLLANSLFLSALKTSVSSLWKKSISHEHLKIKDISFSMRTGAWENFNHYNIMKAPILTVLVSLVTYTEFLLTLSVQYQGRQVMRVMKNINQGIIGWSNSKFSNLTSHKERQQINITKFL